MCVISWHNTIYSMYTCVSVYTCQWNIFCAFMFVLLYFWLRFTQFTLWTFPFLYDTPHRHAIELVSPIIPCVITFAIELVRSRYNYALENQLELNPKSVNFNQSIDSIVWLGNCEMTSVNKAKHLINRKKKRLLRSRSCRIGKIKDEKIHQNRIYIWRTRHNHVTKDASL